jgi:hypothetical protein
LARPEVASLEVIMSLDRVIELYLTIAGVIYVVFERLEKYSSKSDLELYYLVITIKRENVIAVWHEATIRFFDKLFGIGLKLGSLILPRLSRVFLLTCSIHLLFYILMFRSMPMSTFGNVTLLPIVTSLVISVPFDFVSFAKTRLIIRAASRSENGFYWLFLILIDAAASCVLAGIALTAFWFAYFYFVTSFAENHPQIFASVFHIARQLDPDGAVNWEHTFESVTDMGNLVINIAMQLASAGVSFLAVSLLVLSLASARLMRKAAAIQKFLDQHTSIEEKPLQIVGAIGIVIFSIAFWTCYGIGRVA